MWCENPRLRLLEAGEQSSAYLRTSACRDILHGKEIFNRFCLSTTSATAKTPWNGKAESRKRRFTVTPAVD